MTTKNQEPKDPQTATQRFLTTETNSGDITAHTEEEFLANRDIIDNEDIACWVWHYSRSKEEAVENHVRKHRQWERDVNSGKPEKDTY